MKDFLTSPSVIQKLRPDQPFLVYLVVSEEAINVTLVQKVENEERPIYFVNRMLHAAKMRYQMIEKVALALVLTTRQMRPYFQKHSITVRTDYPIFKILSKPDLVGRIIGWSVEISEFDIWYQPRGAIKSQCLAELTWMARPTRQPVEQESSWKDWVISSGASTPVWIQDDQQSGQVRGLAS